MTWNININLSFSNPAEEALNLDRHKKVMAKLSELAGILKSQGDRLEKVKIEVQKLKDMLGDIELPPEVTVQLNRVGNLIATVDEVNEDETLPPVP